MYIEKTSEKPCFAIQDLSDQDIYILLTGLEAIREKIQLYPTAENIRYKSGIEEMILKIKSL